MAEVTERLRLKGVLQGHNGWVTQIATTSSKPNQIVSSSRDKTIVLWELSDSGCGVPKKRLCGHNHFVHDVALSNDGQVALSGSWDSTLRLWDLNSGTTIRRFVGHTGDVLSVAFSPDNRQIASASRDKTVKLWNTLGICKFTFDVEDGGHTEWPSCIRFSPGQGDPTLVSCGWDRVLKVWSLAKMKLKTNFYGHRGYLSCVSLSPDGTLCASGGKDGDAMLWDLSRDAHVRAYPCGDPVSALAFNPARYWLCTASGPSVALWDLDSDRDRDQTLIDEVKVETLSAAATITCTSVAWSGDGQTLLAGYTDGCIRIYEVITI